MKKKLLTGGLALMSVPLTNLAVYAAGTENTAVTGAFSTMADDVIATMAPIGVAAISLFAIIIAWKFAKKIFSRVAS